MVLIKCCECCVKEIIEVGFGYTCSFGQHIYFQYQNIPCILIACLHVTALLKPSANIVVHKSIETWSLLVWWMWFLGRVACYESKHENLWRSFLPQPCDSIIPRIRTRYKTNLLAGALQWWKAQENAELFMLCFFNIVSLKRRFSLDIVRKPLCTGSARCIFMCREYAWNLPIACPNKDRKCIINTGLEHWCTTVKMGQYFACNTHQTNIFQ